MSRSTALGPRVRRFGAAAAIGAAAVAAATLSHVASASASAQHPVTKTPVYQAKVTNVHDVLGPQSAPTTLTSTRPLPAGNYLVTATVASIMAPHDQVVCAVAGDGVYGYAGNPGEGGIYGTAAITDSVRVTAGQRISVTCNSFNYGGGTYVGSAVLNAVPATVHS